MTRLVLICAALLVICACVPTIAETASGYQRGTIVKERGGQTPCQLIGPNLRVWIKPCGDFETRQTVDYRIEGEKAYIRRDNGNDYTCLITQSGLSSGSNATYEAGTIIGYTVRRDIDEPAKNNTRFAKVYELKGASLVYFIDYCGTFQAGKFSPGQVVQFRVDRDDDRLYVLHDRNKEFSCQLEGMRLIRAGDAALP